MVMPEVQLPLSTAVIVTNIFTVPIYIYISYNFNILLHFYINELYIYEPINDVLIKL